MSLHDIDAFEILLPIIREMSAATRSEDGS
jgi:hypothetical protein